MYYQAIDTYVSAPESDKRMCLKSTVAALVLEHAKIPKNHLTGQTLKLLFHSN